MCEQFACGAVQLHALFLGRTANTQRVVPDSRIVVLLKGNCALALALALELSIGGREESCTSEQMTRRR